MNHNAKFIEFVDTLKKDHPKLDDYLKACKDYATALTTLAAAPNTKQLELLRYQEIANHIKYLAESAFDELPMRVDVYRGSLESDITARNPLRTIWTGVDLTIVKNYPKADVSFDMWHIYMQVEDGLVNIRESGTNNSDGSYNDKVIKSFNTADPDCFNNLFDWLKMFIVVTCKRRQVRYKFV